MRLLTITAALLLAPCASAQDPYADYNAARAYRHFLNSPSSLRTYSSYRAGHVWGYDTPLEAGRFWQTPSYYHERISWSGREVYGVPPAEGGYIVRRPVLVSPPVIVPRPVLVSPPVVVYPPPGEYSR